MKHLHNIVIHSKISWTTSKTLKQHETLIIRCDDIGARCGDVGARRGDRVTGNRQSSYRCGVYGDVGVTPQMCNRVTNHGDMGIFSRPDQVECFRVA